MSLSSQLMRGRALMRSSRLCRSALSRVGARGMANITPQQWKGDPKISNLEDYIRKVEEPVREHHVSRALFWAVLAGSAAWITYGVNNAIWHRTNDDWYDWWFEAQETHRDAAQEELRKMKDDHPEVYAFAESMYAEAKVELNKASEAGDQDAIDNAKKTLDYLDTRVWNDFRVLKRMHAAVDTTQFALKTVEEMQKEEGSSDETYQQNAILDVFQTCWSSQYAPYDMDAPSPVLLARIYNQMVQENPDMADDILIPTAVIQEIDQSRVALHLVDNLVNEGNLTASDIFETIAAYGQTEALVRNSFGMQENRVTKMLLQAAFLAKLDEMNKRRVYLPMAWEWLDVVQYRAERLLGTDVTYTDEMVARFTDGEMKRFDRSGLKQVKREGDRPIFLEGAFAGTWRRACLLQRAKKQSSECATFLANARKEGYEKDMQKFLGVSESKDDTVQFWADGEEEADSDDVGVAARIAGFVPEALEGVEADKYWQELVREMAKPVFTRNNGPPAERKIFEELNELEDLCKRNSFWSWMKRIAYDLPTNQAEREEAAKAAAILEDDEE